MSANKKSTPDRHRQHRARQLVAEHSLTYQQALQQLPKYDLKSALVGYSSAGSWDEISSAGKHAQIHPIVLVDVARATGVTCPLFGNRNMPEKSISLESLLDQVTSVFADAMDASSPDERPCDGQSSNQMSDLQQEPCGHGDLSDLVIDDGTEPLDDATEPIYRLAAETDLGMMSLVSLAEWLGLPVSTEFCNRLTVPMPSEGRSIYITEQRLTLVDLWPKCKTKEQKEALASKLGIRGIPRAYNLYSRSAPRSSLEAPSSPEARDALAAGDITKQGTDAAYKLYRRGVDTGSYD